MRDSFLKQGSGLQGSTELRNLLGGECPRGKLFERAEGNAVGLAQGAIDGTGFGHAHLGMVEDQRRDIAGMSVAIAHEAAALGRFVDRGLKDPEVLLWSAQRNYRFCHDPATTFAQREAQ
jgi:hypothetical protein